MGRRYFYAVVDETHRSIKRQSDMRTGSWQGYENNDWYQKARQKTGRKPI